MEQTPTQTQARTPADAFPLDIEGGLRTPAAVLPLLLVLATLLAIWALLRFTAMHVMARLRPAPPPVLPRHLAWLQPLLDDPKTRHAARRLYALLQHPQARALMATARSRRTRRRLARLRVAARRVLRAPARELPRAHSPNRPSAPRPTPP